MSEYVDEIMECFDLIKRISDKLSRDERNAIMGIIKSHKDEAEFYRKKYEELKPLA